MEKELIKKVREGDHNAFSKLIDTYKSLAFSIAIKIVKNELDAEEIVQDAFVKVYENINRFRNESKFSTWLYSIVYNTAISKARLKKLKISDLEESTTSIDQSLHHVNSALSDLETDNRKELINKAMAKLNEFEYTLISLYYYEEKEVSELAKILDIDKSNVKTSLFRIRKKIYAELEKTLNFEFNDIRYER